MKRHYESADTDFPADAYKLRGDRYAIAYYVRGWETAPDDDTEWTGIEERTGQVIVTMIGDDRRIPVDPDDLIALDDLDYCGECGQIGCTHDGRDRSDNV